MTGQVLIPVSIGEMWDKITILRLKARHIPSGEALRNVRGELMLLEGIAHKRPVFPEQDALIDALQEINQRLWDIEDDLRMMERKGQFDMAFIARARQVYLLNDQRAAIKKQINQEAGSELVEEKFFTG